MRLISKRVARLEKKRRVSLRKERVKSYKVILNALTAGNKAITRGTAILN